MAGAIAISPGLGQRRGWQPALADAATAGRVTLDDLAAWRQRIDQRSAAA